MKLSPAGMQQTRVTVMTADGKSHDFTAELALSDDEKQRGMMERQSIAPDRGMLFVYQEPQMMSFWMKNTYIPLDLIFIAPDHKIVRIEENAIPLSLDPLLSLEPAIATFEIAGGRAAELGIKAGDTVNWAE